MIIILGVRSGGEEDRERVRETNDAWVLQTQLIYTCKCVTTCTVCVHVHTSKVHTYNEGRCTCTHKVVCLECQFHVQLFDDHFQTFYSIHPL